MAAEAQYVGALQDAANTANGLIGLWLFQKTIPALMAVKKGVFCNNPVSGRPAVRLRFSTRNFETPPLFCRRQLKRGGISKKQVRELFIKLKKKTTCSSLA
jgi:hypothetical protein